MTKRIEADWNTWAFIPTTSLQEAVFLSLDLEPDPKGFNGALVMDYAKAGKSDPIGVLRELNRRMKIACANVDELAKFSMSYHRDTQKAKVSLSKFGTWAEGMEWSLPDKFPRQPAPAHHQTSDVTDCEAVAAPVVTVQAEPAPAQNATPAPVVAIGKKWTPEKLAELKAFREAHTETETAKQFSISGARIRQLLPTGKPKKKPYSVFTHRI